jgi:hypothetical protein
MRNILRDDGAEMIMGAVLQIVRQPGAEDATVMAIDPDDQPFITAGCFDLLWGAYIGSADDDDLDRKRMECKDEQILAIDRQFQNYAAGIERSLRESLRLLGERQTAREGWGG